MTRDDRQFLVELARHHFRVNLTPQFLRYLADRTGAL